MENKDPPDKVKRTDVSARKLKNKTIDFVSVKTSLNSNCKSKVFVDALHRFIYNLNIIKDLSYYLLNYEFTYCLDNNLDLPSIEQNLFYRACCAVSYRSDKQKENIVSNNLDLDPSEFHYAFDKKILPSREKMGALISYLNKQQLTMTQNHLILNLYQRLKTYISLVTGEKRPSVLYDILNDIYNPQYKDECKTKKKFPNPLVIRIQELIGMEITDKNIKNNMSHFIKIYHKILKKFEQYPKTKWVRKFNLLPTKGDYLMSYIEIDSTCILDIISYISGTPVRKDVDVDKIWRDLFNINEVETKKRRFAYAIMTDGKGLSFRLSKLKNANKMKPEEYIKYLQKKTFELEIGIDPGVSSMITSSASNSEIYQKSTKQYRHDSKMNYNTSKRQSWYSKWDLYSIWKNIPSFKVSNCAQMIEYFNYVMPYIHKFYEFHLEKNFRGLKFNAYCRNRSVIETICKDIVNGGKYNKKQKNVIIGFGDFSQKDRMGKGSPRAPIQKIKHFLRQYAYLLDIDEYCTSKTCHLCHNKVSQYKNRVITKRLDDKTKEIKYSKPKLSEIYKVIRCKSNECKLSCMNRDINASKNILYLLTCILEGKERPIVFSRANK